MTNMREEGRYTEIAIRVDKHQLKLRESERNTEKEEQGIHIYIDRGKREIYINIDRGRKNNIHLPSLQSAPVNPPAHVHVKDPSLLLHVPPF
jgi:hypothetical protein